jgi:hypothetical protein
VSYHETVIPDAATAGEALRELVDEYRSRCLWFLAPGYYPETLAERLRVLDSISRYGDLQAFKRAGAVRQWVLATSSERSAGS